MPAGRPPKPIAQHLIEGTYDKRRHAHRYQPRGDGVPVMPPELARDAVAAESFQRNAAALAAAGIATEVDSAALAAQAVTYSLLLRMASKPAMSWHEFCAFVALDKQWLATADKLGMTPVGRARLGYHQTNRPDDPAGEFVQ